MTKGHRVGHSSGNREVVSIALPTLRGTVTLWVILACVGVYVGLALLNLLEVWSRQTSCPWIGLSWVGLSQGRWWQIVTWPFLHFGVPHLVFNMLGLAFLGVDIEQRLGKLSYVAFSVICALTGAAGFLALGHAQAICGGYSGVLYGLMAACAVLWPERIILMSYFIPIKMKWAMLLMALMALFLTVEPGNDAVAHSAHLGGAAAGFVYIRLWQRGETPKQTGAAAETQTAQPSVKMHNGNQIPIVRVPDEL